MDMKNISISATSAAINNSALSAVEVPTNMKSLSYWKMVDVFTMWSESRITLFSLQFTLREGYEQKPIKQMLLPTIV